MLKIARVDPFCPDPGVIAAAAELLRSGGLVGFPTETVYGVGANALDPVAVGRIYSAKERPSYNPLIVHVANVPAAISIVRGWDARAQALADAFWPGPLTLVFPKDASIGPEVTAELDTVGVRIPSHPVALRLLEAASVPVAAPSANRFMQLSPTTGSHVARGLGDRIDLLLDAGPTRFGIESTVLNLSREIPVLLRAGSVSRDRIEAVIGPIADPPRLGGVEPRPAPGMVARHYAPRAALTIIAKEGDPDPGGWRPSTAVDGRVAALLIHLPDPPRVHEVIRMPDDPEAYGHELYARLHALDERGFDRVLVEAVPEGEAWAGVRDRLARASAAV